MRVLLVARDVAPSLALAKVADYLKRDESNDVRSFLGNGKPIENAYDAQGIAEHPCVVFCGMSSSPELAKEEIAVAQVAVEMGMPFGFYADTFNCHARPWFAPFRDKASFLFVINEPEAESAREMFPNASVVISGNPMWERFFYPKTTREEVRRKLEIKEDQKMVFCPGGKDLVVNIQHFGAVISAISMLDPNPNNWVVVLGIHGGDENYSDLYKYNKTKSTPEVPVYDKINPYLSLLENSGIPVKIVPQSVIPGSYLIPGADIVIESASTVGIEVACQRKPVIDFFSETALVRLEKGGNGRNWPLCQQGAAARVDYDPSALVNKIAELLFYGQYAQMLKRQELHYPTAPEKGATVLQMAETLKEFAGARKN